MNKQTVILFDIDYTLFDTTKFKDIIAKRLLGDSKISTDDFFKTLDTAYYKSRKNGHFEPSLFASSLRENFQTSLTDKEIETTWYDPTILANCLYPETITTMQSLQKMDIVLGVFSTGNEDFQLAKISLLTDFLDKRHIHIFSDKEEQVTEMVELYRDNKLFLVDDFVEVLKSTKDHNPDVVAVWMKRGKFAEKAIVPEGFEPDAVITSLSELLSLVDKSDTV